MIGASLACAACTTGQVGGGSQATPGGGGPPASSGGHVWNQHKEIIKTLFQCDLTRVISFTFGYGNSGMKGGSFLSLGDPATNAKFNPSGTYDKGPPPYMSDFWVTTAHGLGLQRTHRLRRPDVEQRHDQRHLRLILHTLRGRG